MIGQNRLRLSGTCNFSNPVREELWGQAVCRQLPWAGRAAGKPVRPVAARDWQKSSDGLCRLCQMYRRLWRVPEFGMLAGSATDYLSLPSFGRKVLTPSGLGSISSNFGGH